MRRCQKQGMTMNAERTAMATKCARRKRRARRRVGLSGGVIADGIVASSVVVIEVKWVGRKKQVPPPPKNGGFGMTTPRGGGLNAEWAVDCLRRCGKLLGGLVFAEAFQAVAESALQRSGRVGVESDQVPERLAAIFA